MQIFNEKQMATLGRVDMFYCGADSTAHLPSNDGFIGRVTAFMSSTNETLLHWHHLDNGSCFTLLEVIHGTRCKSSDGLKNQHYGFMLEVFFLPWLIHKIKTQGASLVIVNDPPTLSSCNQWQMLGQGKLSSLLSLSLFVTDVKLGTLVSSDCGGRKQTKVHDNTNTYLINFISFHSFCSIPLYPSNGQISELSK